MKTSHTIFSETNHEDAIARELNWLLTADPLWSSAPDHDCVPLKKICNGSVEEIAKNLSMNGLVWGTKTIRSTFRESLNSNARAKRCVNS